MNLETLTVSDTVLFWSGWLALAVVVGIIIMAERRAK